MQNFTHQVDSAPSMPLPVDAHPSSELQPDAELLTLYIEGGSRAAIETLIRRHSNMVASVCRSTIADSSSAEDAFQATFLVLLQSARKIQRCGSVAAWLHGVAYRISSRLRKRRFVPMDNDSVDEVGTSRSATDPLIHMARQMELEALDQELQKLPRRLREILVEHYLLGHTAPQIAHRMELTTSAVEGRLRRGRQALRSMLARRGISLSILVASATYFQQQVLATEASGWTSRFFDQHFPDGSAMPDLSSSQHHSSLVKGELTMFGATQTKMIAIASILLLLGGMVSLQALGVEEGQNGDADVVADKETYVMDSLPKLPPSINAQVALQPESSVVFGSVSGLAPDSPAPPTASTSTATQPTDGTALTRTPKPDAVAWEKPESDPPAWLDASLSDPKLQQTVRTSLHKTIEVSFEELPLGQAVADLCEVISTDVYLNEVSLEDIGLSADTPVNLKAKGPAREILRRMLASLDLDYVVRDSGIEISTKDSVDNEPPTRYYDLSYVLPNSDNVGALTLAMENQIEPDAWVNSGGTWSHSLVGSMLIVGCSEDAHYRIEMMLCKIAAMNRANLEQRVPWPQIQIPAGGMGGGGMF